MSTKVNVRIRTQLHEEAAQEAGVWSGDAALNHAAEHVDFDAVATLKDEVSAAEILDLKAGETEEHDARSLTGALVIFTGMNVFTVKNTAAAGDLTVGGGVTPWDLAFTAVIIPPGGTASFIAPEHDDPWVVDATHKFVTFTPSAGTITFEVYMAGMTS